MKPKKIKIKIPFLFFSFGKFGDFFQQNRNIVTIFFVFKFTFGEIPPPPPPIKKPYNAKHVLLLLLLLLLLF
jgi:hypothetical protein